IAIGTSPDNEIVLSDPTVSRYHLELHCEEGVLVRDLGSRNGTFVNDVRIREAIVPVGARVRLGGSVLLLLDAGLGAPAPAQPALLGVLGRRSFRRVGGKEDLQVDVRVISATHRDLRAEANQGTFRADLYFRLAVARIHIPPLRERQEDIEALVEHFAREITG